MALLDSTSLYSNNTIVTKWANDKCGSIIPFGDNQYIFVEHEHVDELLQEKYSESEWKEKCPVLAYGFVSYWLRNRKRKTKRAERLDLFAPVDRGKTPKEIYDLYIDTRKKWFLEYMSNRPDAWRYTDLEKLFYEQNLTAASEEELIQKSEPLLDYLDEEDKKEFIDVMGNFLGYVECIVEPYQHGKENAADQKTNEQNNRSIDAFCKHAQEKTGDKWPNPKRKYDDKVYTLDSPEILNYARSLTSLQTEILRQLVANAGNIKRWQENPILNQYSEPEIWEACCPLFTDSIILAFIDMGHVSALKILDKGKLVLRKKNALIDEKPSKPRSEQKPSKKKSAKLMSKEVTSIDKYPTFTYNYPDKTDQQKLFRAKRLIEFHKYLVKWKWIPKDTKVDDVFELFTGTKCNNLIKWICNKSSNGVLGYLFRQLIGKSIIIISKDAGGVSMCDILSMHFVDSEGCPMDKTRLSKDSYREPKRLSEKIAILINILDPANTKMDVIEDDDSDVIMGLFNNYGLGKEEKDTMSNISRSKLSGRKR